MAGSARQIVIEFLGKDNGLGAATSSLDGKTSKLGGTLSKVGKVALLGLAAGAVVAGKALYDAGKAAIEDEKSQAALANTMRNTAGANDKQIAATEEWITKQGIAKGVADDELRPALQRLMEATGDVGESQKLASLAMDVSAGTGKSLKTVSEALMKAQNGQVSGLSRLGIETKNAAGDTLTFEQATRKMADTFGGAATAQANTLEGKMARLKLIFDETKETIGAKLIPVVTQLADFFLAHVLPAITTVGAYIQVNIVPILRSMAEAITSNMDTIRPFLPILGAMAGAIVVIVAAVKAWSIAQALLNLVMTANPIGLVIVGIAALAAALVVAYHRSETFRSIVQGAFQGIKAVWDAVGPTLINSVQRAFQTIREVIGGALDVIKGVVRVFSGVLRGDWDQVWDGIKQILRGATTALRSILDLGLDAMKAAARAAWEAIKDKAGELWGAVKTAIGNKLDDIKNAAANAWGDVRSKANDIWNDIKTTIGNKAQDIVDGVRAIPGKLRDLAGSFKDAGAHIIGAFVDGLKNAAGVVAGIAGNVWDALRGTLNNAISRINSALEFTIKVGPKSFGINPPDIPMLATGGIVRARQGGTLALLGEGGHDEAVVPLSGPHAPRGGFGEQTLVLDLRLDGKTMQKVLLKLKRDSGGLELGLA